MILAIVPHEDKLIVATGNEGQVFSVDPSLSETTVLADLDSSQVTCATQTDKGLLLSAANPGALMAWNWPSPRKVATRARSLMPGRFQSSARSNSPPISRPIPRLLSSYGPAMSATRNRQRGPSGPRPLRSPMTPTPIRCSRKEIKIDVPPARYLQYRLTLKGDGETTPVVDQADLAYVVPNTPPTVAKLTMKPAAVPAPGVDPDPKLQVAWQANDANSDRLVYSLEYKPGKADRYLPLAKDLTQPKYDWQTQHVPDGWYTLRVTADDKLDNPLTSAKTGGRVSEPILIDNTDPALKDLKAEVLGNGQIKLSATAEDEFSPIVGFLLNRWG